MCFGWAKKSNKQNDSSNQDDKCIMAKNSYVVAWFPLTAHSSIITKTEIVIKRACFVAIVCPGGSILKS